MKFDPEDLLHRLPLPADEKWKDGVWDIEAFRKRGVSLIFFAPRGKDYQTSHEEDEFYFLVKGSGELKIGEKRISCTAGDALYVPAGVSHRFENFTDDFAAWAVFF
ncbi:MAG: cupin domain-containing protein [Pyrinomonadaceae bacterium]